MLSLYASYLQLLPFIFSELAVMKSLDVIFFATLLYPNSSAKYVGTNPAATQAVISNNSMNVYLFALKDKALSAAIKINHKLIL